MIDTTLEEALEHIESLKAKNYEAYRMLEETKKMMYQRGDAVQRVRELHGPEPKVFDGQTILCSHCMNNYGDNVLYPCDTIKALDGEQ